MLLAEDFVNYRTNQPWLNNIHAGMKDHYHKSSTVEEPQIAVCSIRQYFTWAEFIPPFSLKPPDKFTVYEAQMLHCSCLIVLERSPTPLFVPSTFFSEGINCLNKYIKVVQFLCCSLLALFVCFQVTINYKL